MNQRYHHSSIYDFAASCRVGISEACRRAKIAPSTPARWKAGHVPRPAKEGLLRDAIIELARERGTLPPELRDSPMGASAPAELNTNDRIREGLSQIRRTATDLEALLGRR